MAVFCCTVTQWRGLESPPHFSGNQSQSRPVLFGHCIFWTVITTNTGSKFTVHAQPGQTLCPPAQTTCGDTSLDFTHSHTLLLTKLIIVTHDIRCNFPFCISVIWMFQFQISDAFVWVQSWMYWLLNIFIACMLFCVHIGSCQTFLYQYHVIMF